ncbi:MAG: winged helix-turn-helix domain-containing protein [Planctomycetota bacterium]
MQADHEADSGNAAPLRVGRITVHPESYEVYVDQDRVELTLTQFKLIHAMAKRPGWVMSAEQFNRRFAQTTRAAAASNPSIKHHIAALRRKLGVGAVQVQTVRGQGYRLAETPINQPPPVHTDPAKS